eukprot:1052727-Alexandrium_andersonii.AAC.1
MSASLVGSEMCIRDSPKGTLAYEETEQVRSGTYFTLQSVKAATIAVSMGAGFALENPEPGGNPVSLFCIPEVRALAEWRGVQYADFDQCRYGAQSTKPTRI